jgi:hypothetical protein
MALQGQWWSEGDGYVPDLLAVRCSDPRPVLRAADLTTGFREVQVGYRVEHTGVEQAAVDPEAFPSDAFVPRSPGSAPTSVPGTERMPAPRDGPPGDKVPDLQGLPANQYKTSGARPKY